MKKKIFLILILLIVMTSFHRPQPIGEDTLKWEVFNQTDTLDDLDSTAFYRFYLLFDQVTLSSTNFSAFMNAFHGYDYKIFLINVYTNPMYTESLKEVEKISFYSSNPNEVVTTLYQKYLSKANTLQLDTVINDAEIHGIKICMVGIETSIAAIKYIINQNLGLKYSLNPNGIFLTQ